MKGDGSGSTFDPRERHTGVLDQQGRVQLDADRNEQDAVHHRLRLQMRDLIGDAAGPLDDAGFAITLDEKSGRVTIAGGRYYVGGLMCENARRIFWDDQPSVDTVEEHDHEDVVTHLYYLDVWERRATAVEDPDLRGPALAGADTA